MLSSVEIPFFMANTEVVLLLWQLIVSTDFLWGKWKLEILLPYCSYLVFFFYRNVSLAVFYESYGICSNN